MISKYSTHLIKIACEVAINKRKKLVINGSNYKTVDGTPVRDYIHVSDLADIHLISTKYLLNNGYYDKIETRLNTHMKKQIERKSNVWKR